LDYSKNFKIKENNFDLLLGLFSGKLITNFKKYLKDTGIMILNNFNNEIIEVFDDESFELKEIILGKNNNYKIENKNVLNKNKIIKKNNIIKSNIGIEYRDNEVYYVFKLIKNAKLLVF
jgi:hypothetical protein